MLFSVIPVGNRVWDEKSMPYVLASFPLVGLVIGVIWYLFTEIIYMIGFPLYLSVVFVMLVPFLLSGFIHIDGFMDTSDAVFSSVSREKRLEILKDSRSGTFAVVSVIILFLILLPSVYYAYINKDYFIMLVFIPVISRGLCSIAIYTLKSVSENGMAASLKKGSGLCQILIVISTLLLAIITSFALCKITALAVLFAEILFFALAVLFGYKRLQGICGDLCGFALSISETAAVFILSLNLFRNVLI